MGGPTSADLVMELCDVILSDFESDDVCELDDEAVEYVKQAKVTVRSLVAVYRAPIDPSYADDVDTLRYVEGQKGDTPKHKVLSTMRTETFWSGAIGGLRQGCCSHQGEGSLCAKLHGEFTRRARDDWPRL